VQVRARALERAVDEEAFRLLATMFAAGHGLAAAQRPAHDEERPFAPKHQPD
jgi:hypothetical protein